MGGSISIGEGPEYRPFHDLRSVPEAGRPREHVKNRGVQVLLLGTAPLGAGIFSLFLNSDKLACTFRWLDPSPPCLVPSNVK